MYNRKMKIFFKQQSGAPFSPIDRERYIILGSNGKEDEGGQPLFICLL
jgi:hypothetical protein